MKTKTISTSEFYKNPSKAISFVKEGGTIYLGYKGLKDPIAVLTGYSNFDKEGIYKKKEKNLKYKNNESILDNIKDLIIDYKKPLSTKVENPKNLFEKYGHLIISTPEYLDSTKYIRKMRDTIT